jgi:hypothetical protein
VSIHSVLTSLNKSACVNIFGCKRIKHDMVVTLFVTSCTCSLHSRWLNIGAARFVKALKYYICWHNVLQPSKEIFIVVIDCYVIHTPAPFIPAGLMFVQPGIRRHVSTTYTVLVLISLLKS